MKIDRPGEAFARPIIVKAENSSKYFESCSIDPEEAGTRLSSSTLRCIDEPLMRPVIRLHHLDGRQFSIPNRSLHRPPVSSGIAKYHWEVARKVHPAD